MNKLSWGSISIILGSILLSLELYGLEFYANAMGFETDGFVKYNKFIGFSLGVMCLLIIYGVLLIGLHLLEERKK